MRGCFWLVALSTGGSWQTLTQRGSSSSSTGNRAGVLVHVKVALRSERLLESES
jgi:hypothetical protein